MLVQLPTGNTVILKVEDYLKMNDERYRFLIAHNLGSYLGNPFSFSALDGRDVDEFDEQEDEDDEIDEVDMVYPIEGFEE